MPQRSQESEPLTDGEMAEFEAKLDKTAEYSALVVKSERFLGLFEPHDLLRGFNLLRGAADERQSVVGRQTDNFIRQGFQVAICFEHGKKGERVFFREMDKLLRTGRETDRLSWKDLFLTYNYDAFVYDEEDEIVDVKDEDAAHSFLTLLAFLGWQRGEERKDKVWGFLEKMPNSIPNLGRSLNIAKSDRYKKDERVNRLTQTLAYVASRDLGVAGQIIDEMQSSEEPLAAVAIRGTSHLGLAPALSVLGREIYDDDVFGDLDRSRKVKAGDIHYAFLPVLWSRRLWEEMISENKIDYRATCWDSTYSKVYRWTRRRLHENPWREYLSAKVAEFDKRRRETLTVELNQTTFE